MKRKAATKEIEANMKKMAEEAEPERVKKNEANMKEYKAIRKD